MTSHITFIGGGNMASAIIGGLLRQGMTTQKIDVVEPYAEARDKLQAQFGITALHGPGPALAKASLVVWAVKPQTFKEAALQTRFHTKQALHLSVAAGIRSDSIASWLGTQRIVRAMPNTPALVGKGMTALFGRPAVTEADRALVNQVMTPTGQFLWVEDESQLDAVTALSGSGPAYVFYFLEAMTQAGADMGHHRAATSKRPSVMARGLHADAQVVVAVDHGVFGVVGQHPEQVAQPAAPGVPRRGRRPATTSARPAPRQTPSGCRS
jgi:pyrroline-5-carboxylate reductase